MLTNCCNFGFCCWCVDVDLMNVFFVDIDECEEHSSLCDLPLRSCLNNVGGYTCGNCSSGYRDNGSMFNCTGKILANYCYFVIFIIVVLLYVIAVVVAIVDYYFM